MSENTQEYTDAQKQELIQSAQTFINLNKNLENLNKNDDFNALLNFYRYNEAIRYTHMLATTPPAGVDPNYFHTQVKENLLGIASFVRFLNSIPALAEDGEKQLKKFGEGNTATQEATPVVEPKIVQ